MEYKTLIEIITEADSPHDAADIAGEYLRGSIETGVHMRCTTKPARKINTGYVIFSLIFLLSLVCLKSVKICNDSNNKENIYRIKNTCAIQPPLKSYVNDDEFNNDWESRNR